MYYLATVEYQSEEVNGRAGRPFKKKYTVQAESVEEATLVINKYNKDSITDWELLSVVKTPIESVIDKIHNPEIYE